MRTYGRTTNPDGSKTWQVVATDASGQDDLVFLTTLCQVIKLDRGESPFFGNYGIPAYQSVIQQLFPDFYASLTQQQFAQLFAALAISRVPNTTPPTYNVKVVCHNGATIEINEQVPT